MQKYVNTWTVHKYEEICKKYMLKYVINMHLYSVSGQKYAKIWTQYALICKNNMQKCTKICKIRRSPYFAYFVYICTPHVADVDRHHDHVHQLVSQLEIYLVVYRDQCTKIGALNQ